LTVCDILFLPFIGGANPALDLARLTLTWSGAGASHDPDQVESDHGRGSSLEHDLSENR
jgi:hypothetical protein